ncbi:MAG: tRNA threonylcarbamoyladenosine dehydratase [Burkholderiaceae bacterium]|nr:tRNA threonylcarbamoyladenosine dehydratase [Betaproteobacteria bacterium]MDP4967058.1 tRNA threonylcarbamoyladenosine dehydratase [Burkholderiaceae bacterium]
MTEVSDFERRFGGLRRLYGEAGAQRIFDCHAVVVGIGGVGSWSAEAFARSGVRRLSLIDLDHIAASNINRQIHATTQTLGQSKVEAMRDRILAINPACQVDCVDDFLSPENLDACLSAIGLPVAAVAKSANSESKTVVVVDACDQVHAKVALASWALTHQRCFVSVGAAGGKRLAHAVDCADIADVTHDPLLAKLRYQLRRNHGASRSGRMGVMGIFSREAVVMPKEENGQLSSDLNCHGYGSAVAVTASFGMAAAGWCLDQVGAG